MESWKNKRIFVVLNKFTNNKNFTKMEYQETMGMSRLVGRVYYALAYNEETNSLYYIDFDTPEEVWNLQELNNGEEDELEFSENSLELCENHATDTLKTQILRLMPQADLGEQDYTEMEGGLHFAKRPDGTWSFTFDKQHFTEPQIRVLSRIEELTK